MKNPKVKSYLLNNVPADLWVRFKEVIPRRITINDMIIKIIDQFTKGELKIPNYGEKKLQKELLNMNNKILDLERDMRVMKESGLSPFEPEGIFPESIKDEMENDELYLKPVKDEDGKTHFKKIKPLKVEKNDK